MHNYFIHNHNNININFKTLRKYIYTNCSQTNKQTKGKKKNQLNSPSGEYFFMGACLVLFPSVNPLFCHLTRSFVFVSRPSVSYTHLTLPTRFAV